MNPLLGHKRQYLPRGFAEGNAFNLQSGGTSNSGQRSDIIPWFPSVPTGNTGTVP